MSLRTSIRTLDDLNALTKTIRATLDLNTIGGLFSRFVTDSDIKDTLDNVVGSKGTKTIKQSEAEKLVCTMLGFKNINAMREHYTTVALFTAEQYIHIHRHGDDAFSVWSQEGVYPTIADLLGFNLVDGSQTRIDERIESQYEHKAGTLREEIPDHEVVIDTLDVVAIMFTPNKDIREDSRYQATLFNNPANPRDAYGCYIDNLESIYEDADNSAFQHSDCRFLKCLRESDIEHAIASQDDFESVADLLRFVTTHLGMGNPVDLKDDHATGNDNLKLVSSDLDGELHLAYSIEAGVFAIVHDGSVIKVLGFTNHKKDIRMKAYYELLG